MARKDIGTSWTRDTRNAMNDNFIELYNEYLGAGNNAADAKRLATEALNTANKAKSEAESTQEQLDNIILNDGTGNAEVVQARGNEPLLKDRLNKTDQQLTQVDVQLNTKIDQFKTTFDQQLAETVEYADQNKSLLNLSKHEKKTLVTFISDDGTIQDYTKLKPIFERTKTPLGLGIVTTWMDTPGHMSTEQIREMQDIGCEVMSHSDIHKNISLMNTQDMEREFKLSKEKLRSKGFNPNMFVYPFNANNKTSNKLMEKYYSGGFSKYNNMNNSAIPGLNTPLIRNSAIDRNAMGSYFDGTGRIPNAPEDTESIEYYKFLVDEAVKSKNWLVFVLHPHATDDSQFPLIEETINYIKGLDIDIVSPSKGLAIYGNIIEIAGSKGEFIINAEGENVGISSSTKMNEHSAESLPSVFPRSSVTSGYVNTGGAVGFPDNTAGTYIVYRIGDQLGYAKQLYMPYLKENLWMRTGKNDDTWGRWVDVNSQGADSQDSYNVSRTLNSYTSSNKPSDFPNHTVTSFAVNALGASGFPENKEGTVTTYRVGDQLGYAKQLYMPYVSTGLWMRTGRGADTWDGWTNLSAGSGDSIVHKTKNPYTNSSPVTDYPINKVSVYRYDAVSNAGYPTPAGIITTYRMDDTAWSMQECRQYRGSGLWNRYWSIDSWSSWVKISAV